MVAPNFQQIDDTAWQADRVYDVGLLRDAHGNADNCHTKRGRMAACYFGDIDSSNNRLTWRVCSFRQRAYFIAAWHLNPGVTALEVIVRHTTSEDAGAGGVTGGGTEITIDAIAMPIDALLGGRPVLAEATGSATADVDYSTSAENTKLTVDVSSLQTGWIAVLVGFESGEGTPVLIDTVAGSKGEDVLNGWQRAYVEIDSTVHTTYYNGDEIPCQGIEFEDQGTGDDDDRLPAPRQVISVDQISTSDYRLYTYPGFPDTSANAGDNYDDANDQANQIPLGYADVYGITIRDKTISQIEGIGQADKDATRPTSILHPQQIYRQAVDAWSQRTRVHHIGPSYDPGDEDSDYSGQGLSLASSHIDLSTSSWQTLGRCVVGDDEDYTYSGTTYTRTAYTILGLVVVSHLATRGRADHLYEIDWRVYLTDLDGTSNAKASTTLTEFFPTQGLDDSSHFVTGERQAAYLLSFYKRGNRAARRRHALRGLLPADCLEGSFIAPVQISVTDDQTTAYRLLRLQAQGASTKTKSGQTISPLPSVHLVTWTVLTTPTDDLATFAADQGTT